MVWIALIDRRLVCVEWNQWFGIDNKHSGAHRGGCCCCGVRSLMRKTEKIPMDFAFHGTSVDRWQIHLIKIAAELISFLTSREPPPMKWHLSRDMKLESQSPSYQPTTHQMPKHHQSLDRTDPFDDFRQFVIRMIAAFDDGTASSRWRNRIQRGRWMKIEKWKIISQLMSKSLVNCFDFGIMNNQPAINVSRWGPMIV